MEIPALGVLPVLLLEEIHWKSQDGGKNEVEGWGETICRGGMKFITTDLGEREVSYQTSTSEKGTVD